MSAPNQHQECTRDAHKIINSMTPKSNRKGCEIAHVWPITASHISLHSFWATTLTISHSLQIWKFLSWNLCGLEEGINSPLMLPHHNKITKVQFVRRPLLSYLYPTNSNLSKNITKWCVSSIVFQQIANRNDQIIIDLTICKVDRCLEINFQSLINLQMYWPPLYFVALPPWLSKHNGENHPPRAHGE